MVEAELKKHLVQDQTSFLGEKAEISGDFEAESFRLET